MLSIRIGCLFFLLLRLSFQQILQDEDMPLPDRRFYSYPLYDDDEDESNCNGCLFNDVGYFQKPANNLPPRYGVRDSQDANILPFNNVNHESYSNDEPYSVADTASYGVRQHAPIDTDAYVRTPYTYRELSNRLRPLIKTRPKHRTASTAAKLAHNRKYMSYILGKLKSDVTASRKSDAMKPLTTDSDKKGSNGTLTHERKQVLGKLLKLLKLFTFVQIQSLAANQSTSTTMKTLDADIFGQLNDNNSTSFNPTFHQKLAPNKLYVTDDIKKLSADYKASKPENHQWLHHHHAALKDDENKLLNIKNIDEILDSLVTEDSITSVPPLPNKKENKTKNFDKQDSSKNTDSTNHLNKTLPFAQNSDKKSDKLNDNSTDFGLEDSTNNELIDRIATSVDSFGGLLDDLISNHSLDYIWHIQNDAMRSNGNNNKDEDDENDENEASSFADMLLQLVNMFNTTTPTPTSSDITPTSINKNDVDNNEVTYDIVPPVTEDDGPSLIKEPTWTKPSFAAPTSSRGQNISLEKLASSQGKLLKGPLELATAHKNASSEKTSLQGSSRGTPFIPKASLDDDDDEFVLPLKTNNFTATNNVNTTTLLNSTKESGEGRNADNRIISATEAKLDKKITQVFTQVVNELDDDEGDNLFGDNVIGLDVMNSSNAMKDHEKLAAVRNNQTFAGEISEKLSSGLLSSPVKQQLLNTTTGLTFATNKTVAALEKIPQAKEIFEKLAKNMSAYDAINPHLEKASSSAETSFSVGPKIMMLSEEMDVEEGSGRSDKDSYANVILLELRNIFNSIKTSKFPAENEHMFHAYINELMKSPMTNRFLQSIHKNTNTSVADSLDPERPLTEKFIDLIKFADLNKKVIPFYGKRTILDQLSTINDDSSRTNTTTANTGDIPAADPAESKLTFSRVLQSLMKKVREHEVRSEKKAKLSSNKFKQILKNLK